jgi:hypothetical protein
VRRKLPTASCGDARRSFDLIGLLEFGVAALAERKGVQAMSVKIMASAAVMATFFALGALPASAECVQKAAEGTGGTEESAKFQVYEALLQATDWGAWAAWMANGTTPGYKVSTPKYKCTKGSGLSVTCRGQATICKL